MSRNAEGMACVKALSRKRIWCLQTWFEELTERQCTGNIGNKGPVAGKVDKDRSAQPCEPLLDSF